MEEKRPKKSIAELLDQMALAYDRDLILGYSYDDLTYKLIIEFYPRNNLPIQTLVRHIETNYAVEYVHVKNSYTKLLICVKFGKYTLNSVHKTIVRLPKSDVL